MALDRWTPPKFRKFEVQGPKQRQIQVPNFADKMVFADESSTTAPAIWAWIEKRFNEVT